MAFTRPLLKIPIFLFTVALGLVIYQVPKSSSLQSIASSSEDQSVSSYLWSWKTWFHASQSKATGLKQSPVKGWNVLHHLGGNGPWIENAGEGVASNLAPPDGCLVDQVHLVCLMAIITMIMLIGPSYLVMENDIQHLLPGVVGQPIRLGINIS